MEYTDISNPKVIAGWFQTTTNNIGKTYQHRKTDIYELQCIATFVAENSITAEELIYARDMIVAQRLLPKRRMPKKKRIGDIHKYAKK